MVQRIQLSSEIMEFDYTIETKRDFPSSVLKVQEELTRAGFRVLYIHDVMEKLDEKGFTVEPMKIIEFCNAKSAYSVLQENKKIGLCLPCKILVYRENDKTHISGMSPLVLFQFFPQADLGTIPQETEILMKIVIDNSK